MDEGPERASGHPSGHEPGHKGDGRHHGPLRWYAERRAAARSRASVDIIWRLGVGIAGALVIVTGIAMLALPGPGWGTIILGLAVLSTEFAWARRLRVRVMARIHEFTERHPGGRRIPIWGWVVLVLLLLVMTAAVLLIFGVPDWLTGWWPG